MLQTNKYCAVVKRQTWCKVQLEEKATQALSNPPAKSHLLRLAAAITGIVVLAFSYAKALSGNGNDPDAVYRQLPSTGQFLESRTSCDSSGGRFSFTDSSFVVYRLNGETISQKFHSTIIVRLDDSSFIFRAESSGQLFELSASTSQFLSTLSITTKTPADSIFIYRDTKGRDSLHIIGKGSGKPRPFTDLEVSQAQMFMLVATASISQTLRGIDGSLSGGNGRYSSKAAFARCIRLLDICRPDGAVVTPPSTQPEGRNGIYVEKPQLRLQSFERPAQPRSGHLPRNRLLLR